VGCCNVVAILSMADMVCLDCMQKLLSGRAPTPAGTSVFTKHNWDMGMGYLWLNGWGIYHGWSIYGLLGWTFMT